MQNNITAAEPKGFIDFATLTTRVPYSARRLRDLVQNGSIPSIRLPGGRKRLFDWSAVAAALRRHTTTAN